MLTGLLLTLAPTLTLTPTLSLSLSLTLNLTLPTTPTLRDRGGTRLGGAAAALRRGNSRLSVVLNRMHADLAAGDAREIALKTASDGWLVGRLSGAREFYMLFDAKYTNFSEVHQEVTSPVYLPCISPETLILSSYPYPYP